MGKPHPKPPKGEISKGEGSNEHYRLSLRNLYFLCISAVKKNRAFVASFHQTFRWNEPKQLTSRAKDKMFLWNIV